MNMFKVHLYSVSNNSSSSFFFLEKEKEAKAWKAKPPA